MLPFKVANLSIVNKLFLTLRRNLENLYRAKSPVISFFELLLFVCLFVCCLFIYLGRSVRGHMLVHEQLMNRARLIQNYKSG